jgi:4-hydroxythreonine-4-phosphate dehydrogenase
VKTVKPLPVIAISGGDPAGIGPQVALRAAADAARLKICVPVLFMHEASLPAGFGKGRRVEIRGSLDEVLEEKEREGKTWLVHTGRDLRPSWKQGSPSVEGAASALESLKAAALSAMRGKAAALVTAPASKQWIGRIEKFPGHTEWLAAFSGVPADDVVMTFVGDRMKIATVTRHLPLKDVPSFLRAETIVSAAVMFCASLILDFRMKRARVGVCSLNPHASDGGLLGDEEATIIVPALETAGEALLDAGWRKKISLSGPLGADGLMRQLSLGMVDGVLAMYHDQAMIAVRIMGTSRWAGYTLGLPFVRTTPAHGTAFDIAGRSSADAGSMAEAIRLAAALAKAKPSLRTELNNIRGLIKIFKML